MSNLIGKETQFSKDKFQIPTLPKDSPSTEKSTEMANRNTIPAKD